MTKSYLDATLRLMIWRTCLRLIQSAQPSHYVLPMAKAVLKWPTWVRLERMLIVEREISQIVRTHLIKSEFSVL